MKALVLDWLTNSDGNLEAFDHLLAEQSSDAEPTGMEQTVDELDSSVYFQPLSDAEMIQKSREALEQYQRTGNGITHQRVQQWAESLGTD